MVGYAICFVVFYVSLFFLLCRLFRIIGGVSGNPGLNLCTKISQTVTGLSDLILTYYQ